jgi:hypothetical protein
MRALSDAVSAQKTQITVEGVSAECAELRSEFFALKAKVGALSAAPPPGRLDSLIISEFPGIFAEFRGKQFKLLWRGSRDGFTAPEFHTKCDGHANTLTVILDTNGNIFGGFTPVEWESRERSPQDKGDDSRKSFLFTLKNPHNVAPMKFKLNPGCRSSAISCGYASGPNFRDLAVFSNCNANTRSFAYLGTTYNNNTELAGDRVLAGRSSFQVKEIEVFEITD